MLPQVPGQGFSSRDEILKLFADQVSARDG
jgi:hypothetical protein